MFVVEYPLTKVVLVELLMYDAQTGIVIVDGAIDELAARNVVSGESSNVDDARIMQAMNIFRYRHFNALTPVRKCREGSSGFVAIVVSRLTTASVSSLLADIIMKEAISDLHSQSPEYLRRLMEHL